MTNFTISNETRIAIIGLGYVGLPLAVEFGMQMQVVGYDINQNRVDELSKGIDSTLEVSSQGIAEAKALSFTANEKELIGCNVYIITVPTPVNINKQPDLTALIEASELVGRVLGNDAVVIYESTVYPGATEEVCIPVIEAVSGLHFNEDFYAGYSPERINPGDKERRLNSIVKVTSGSTNEVAEFIDKLYRSIITAGTYKAKSIKVAEAAKVIENTQRDINIALLNELSQIFNKLGINTSDVLKAAGTKWNFLPFKPGLVGGHCIGVDPYYLAYKAQAVGYHPQMILAGRRMNEGMAEHVSLSLIKKMLQKKIKVTGSYVLVMGLTFKENCPDLRNTKVLDVIDQLKDLGVNVDVYDPVCDSLEATRKYQVSLINEVSFAKYDAIIVAVAHEQFEKLSIADIRELAKSNHVIFDLTNIYDPSEVDIQL